MAAAPDARDLFSKGIREFRSGRFFEAHEEWESLWKDAREPEKRVLQGLIQLAAGCVHLGRGRVAPAERLFGLAEEKLVREPRAPFAIDVERLVGAIRSAREELRSARTLADPAAYFPLGPASED